LGDADTEMLACVGVGVVGVGVLLPPLHAVAANTPAHAHSRFSIGNSATRLMGRQLYGRSLKKASFDLKRDFGEPTQSPYKDHRGGCGEDDFLAKEWSQAA
jgi:hypothetical protein